MLTISVSTEVVCPQRDAVLSEAPLWEDLASSIHPRLTTSLTFTTPTARPSTQRTPLSSRLSCRVTRTTSTRRCLLTQCITIATWPSWRIALSGLLWSSDSSALCTLETSLNAKRWEWLVGSACKISKTLQPITLTTVVEFSLKSNSPVSRSTTRTSTRWWNGTRRLTLPIPIEDHHYSSLQQII